MREGRWAKMQQNHARHGGVQNVNLAGCPGTKSRNPWHAPKPEYFLVGHASPKQNEILAGGAIMYAHSDSSKP